MLFAEDNRSLTFAVCSSGSSLAEDLEQALIDGGFEKAVQSQPNLQFTVGFPTDFEFHPDSHSIIFEWNGYSCVKKGAVYFFSFANWHILCQLRSLGSSTDILLAFDHHSLTVQIPEQFLRLILMWCLRRLGWFESHAGCVDRQGNGFLLLGHSTAGKSSTVFGLIEQGWNFVSDDSVLVSSLPQESHQPPGFLARSFRRFFALRPETLHWYGTPISGHAHQTVKGKIQFNPSQLWPEQSQSNTRIRFLLALTRTTGQHTRILPLSPEAILTRLIPSSLWLMLDRETSPAHLAVFRTLASSCYGFELQLCPDVLQDRARLASLLDPEHLLRQGVAVRTVSDPCSTSPSSPSN
ncbi:MAG: hypothetical protein K1Y36_15225 [Blastocatellia bacterium]|nr:hypothetical protein [Blastocatellia bacterium]